MSTNPNLPSGWTESTFGAVVSAISVNDKKLPRGQYLEAGRFPVVDQGQQFIGGYSNDESRVISEDLPVLVFGDHTRAFKYLNQPFVPGADGVKVLKPHGVDAKWLFEIAHALEFPDKGYARHYQHLKSAKLLVPPLSEQRRIVAEIEKQFTRLEAGVAALRRVQANLKRYRAAVLKAACEGRLVPTEAELQKSEGRGQKSKAIFETGAELLARILAERRQNWQGRGQYKEPSAPDTRKLPPLPGGWAWANVEQLGDVQLGRQRSPKNVSKTYPTKYVRAANITERGIDVSDVLEMEFSPAERERFALRDGDIVLSEASGSPSQVGKPAVWREELPLCCFQNTVLRLRPVVVGPRYVLVAFQHFYANSVFAKVAGGVGINHLGAEKFSAIPFPLPPLAEQTRIVAEVERRLSVVEELESVVTANLLRATRLRQSILQKAFTGELV